MLPTPAARTAEEIYETLASIVASDIQDEWETATIRAVVHDDEDVTFQGIYTSGYQHLTSSDAPEISQNGDDSESDQCADLGVEDGLQCDASQVGYFRTQSHVYDLILELRRILQQAGDKPFTEVDFTLSRSGSYDLSFSYL